MAGNKRKRISHTQSSSGKRRKTILKSRPRLPSYYQIEKEKEKCRLKPEDIYVSESVVRAPLQLMLNLTVRRILLDPKITGAIYDLQKKFGKVRLEFIYKLGKVEKI